MTECLEDRRGELDDEGDGAQEQESQHEGEADADLPRTGPLRLGQLVRQDRYENQVVDTEDDFHHDQRDERRPHGRVDRQFHQIVHARPRHFM